MKPRLIELIKKSCEESDRKLLREAAPDAESQEEVEAMVKESDEVAQILTALMTTHTGNTPQPRGVSRADGKRFLESWQRGEDKTPLNFSEALHSNDASIMFKRVISDILVAPIETEYIGQSVLARTIHIDGARQARFPAMGAIIAGDLSETGEYPTQQPSFTEHMLELKVQKAGLMLEIAEDVIEDSMWDIFGLYVTMAANACNRWKEQKIFNEAIAKANTVFDNSLTTNPAAWTSGVDTSNYLNGSVSFTDLIDCMGGVLSNGYNPTDIIVHPMAWVTFLKDPRLLFHMLTNNPYGQSVPMPALDANAIQKNLPFGGVNVVVTPQMPFQYNYSFSLNQGTASGAQTITAPPANVSTILVLERKASIIVLQRDEKQMEEFKSNTRDIHHLKVSERYGVGALDMGRGIAAMKNVRLVQNHQAVFNIGQGPVV